MYRNKSLELYVHIKDKQLVTYTTLYRLSLVKLISKCETKCTQITNKRTDSLIAPHSLRKVETPVWNDRSISLSSKTQLMRSLVTSIFLYACESWILTAELRRIIQAMEMRCYRKILRISYKDHVTTEGIRAKIQQAIGPHEDLTIVKRRKLQWYGHVSGSSGVTKTSCKALSERDEDKAERG